MKRLILAGLALCSVGVSSVKAQQEPQFTHYMFNKLIYNPGYAGITSSICGTVVHHEQYLAFKGIDKESAPATTSFDIHAPLSNMAGSVASQIGVGFYAVRDNEAWVGTNTFMAAGNYKFVDFLKQGGVLSVGINLGMVGQTLDAKWISEFPNDPRLPGTSSNTAFDAGVGAYYDHHGDWYAGLSATHLPASTLTWTQGNQSATYNMSRVFWFTAGYTYKINGNADYKLLPSTLIKADQAKMSMAINGMFLYKNKYYGALNYRTERINALSLMAGMFQPLGGSSEMKIGYSYDLPTNNASAFGGTHEIMAGLCFKLKVIEKPVVPPRDPRHLGRDPYDPTQIFKNFLN